MTGVSPHVVYRGTVMHARRTPKEHVFRHDVCFYLLDVDRLEELRGPLIGYGRRALLRIDDADHLGNGPGTIAEKVRAFVRSSGAEPPAGRILLATNLRVAGYVFNPVSFFYLLDVDGGTAMIVTEVASTFGESHPYLLSAANEVVGERLRSYTQTKELHVSPFMGMNQLYRFFFSEPGERLYARIDVEEDGGRPLVATIVGRGEPLTRRSLLRVLARHPFMTGKVTALIHWQALKLWLKGVPVTRKPPFDPQRGSIRR